MLTLTIYRVESMLILFTYFIFVWHFMKPLGLTDAIGQLGPGTLGDGAQFET
jgi:hypothetical protein